MELTVIKKFKGKAEGKTLCPGDIIQSTDVERINTLVSRGFCTISALDDNQTETTKNCEADKKAHDKKSESKLH